MLLEEYIPRKFKVIPQREEEKATETHDFKDFDSDEVLVLLGGPGIGKSRSFQKEAAARKKAVFFRIGEFVNLSPEQLSDLSNKSIFLDGLDEFRNKNDGEDILDVIKSKFKTINNTKLRISCRELSWNSGKDLNTLSALTKTNKIKVLQLCPLLVEDILTHYPETKEFVELAEKNKLSGLISNPLEFQLLYRIYLSKGKLLHSKQALFREATRILLYDDNETHGKNFDDVSDQAMFDEAGLLCALILLSNVDGLAVSRLNPDKRFPAIQKLNVNIYAAKHCLQRDLFKPVETKNEFFEPHHRAIAEYIGAEYLTKKVVRGQVPLKRVLALMTGFDGQIASDLRGLFAWFVTFMNVEIKYLMDIEPFTAVLYGDASAWPIRKKQMFFESLQKYADKVPYFRYSGWDEHLPALGNLYEEDLYDDIVGYLQDDENETHFHVTVLHSIAPSETSKEYGDMLLDYVHDTTKDSFLKEHAIAAYIRCQPEDLTSLKKLYKEVIDGKISDDHDYIKGKLLEHLYPKEITAHELADCLPLPSKNIIGDYALFYEKTIFDRSNLEDLIHLLEGHVIGSDDEKWSGFDFQNFVRTTLSKILSELDEDYPIDKILGWFEGCSNHEYYSNLRDELYTEIAKVLQKRGELLSRLFHCFLEKYRSKKSARQLVHSFESLVPSKDLLFHIGTEIVEEIVQSSDQENKVYLYEIFCFLYFRGSMVQLPSGINFLWVLAEQEEPFREIYNEYSYSLVPDWLLKQHSKKQKIHEEADKEISLLKENIEKVSSGESYAWIWNSTYKYFSGNNLNKSDPQPVKNFIDEKYEQELSLAVKTGLKNYLEKAALINLDELKENRIAHQSLLFSAAINLLGDDLEKFLEGLPDERVLQIIHHALYFKNIASPLFKQNVVKSYGDKFAVVFRSEWASQLNGHYLKGLSELKETESGRQVAVTVLLSLLDSANEIKVDVYKQIRESGVLTDEQVREIVTTNFNTKYASDDLVLLWLVEAALLNIENSRSKLNTHLEDNPKSNWFVASLVLGRLRKQDEPKYTDESIQNIGYFLKLLLPLFENVDFTQRGGWVGSENPAEIAMKLRGLISILSDGTSDEAHSILQDLRDLTLHETWHKHIKFIWHQHMLAYNEARFKYSDIKQVAETLSNKQPANHTDLRVLISETLEEISLEYRYGNTDPYKQFWKENSKKGGKVDVSKGHVEEDTARDRLVDALRAKLRHYNFIIEPEAHYAQDKRSDIAVYCGSMKLPIEIKRDDHREIWSACENQLKVRYSSDPNSGGNGIYLVFWFDGVFNRLPPNNHPKPKTPGELANLLTILNKDTEGLIETMVVDVSVPDEKIYKKKSNKKKKAKKS